MTALRECPFCGTPEPNGDIDTSCREFEIWCHRCLASVSAGTPEKAAVKWNTRATEKALQEACELLRGISSNAMEDCGEADCPDCRPWRPIWKFLARHGKAGTK